MEELIEGDCLDELRRLEENSVDSIVTDPPYGWRFMGKAWDGADIESMAKTTKRPGETYVGQDGKTRKTRDDPAMAAGKYDRSCLANRAFQEWTEVWAKEALRVLKPGGHALIFCGPRTYHRMASGVEDAGFEVRDQIQWLFGSGFPKSLDISKAIDKEAGAKREVTGVRQDFAATPDAIKWQGWGTALKPANEPILLARKPLSEKTVAKNVLRHGVGGLNIDASRIEAVDQDVLDAAVKRMTGNTPKGWKNTSAVAKPVSSQGRFPANLILSGDAPEMLDEQSGALHASGNKNKNLVKDGQSMFGIGVGGISQTTDYKDTGGASRFFYCAKVSPSERNAGLEGMQDKEQSRVGQTVWTNQCSLCGKSRPQQESSCGSCGGSLKKVDRLKPISKNSHPTVKPQKLMQYLIKLITPPGGTVLDPFMGSGSTGLACKTLGFHFIGIEKEKEYFNIAERRICGTSASVLPSEEEQLPLG